MDVLSALVAATPLFGLALTLPPAAPPTELLAQVAAQSGAAAGSPSGDAGADDAGAADGAGAGDAGADAAADDAALDANFEAELDLALGGDDDDGYTAALRERAEIAKLHRAFGIATWATMAATLVLGGIQYYNLYGGSRDSNPCVRGDAVFGQGQCSGEPWPHLVGAIATTALYTTTLSLSFLMPDPGGAAEGDSEFAQKLRLHKALRWVHFAGMLAQLILGPIITHAESLGLDRTNDYGTLQALSATHMALGIVTFGALTWSGTLMGMFD